MSDFSDPSEQLFRQIHPNFFKDGEVMLAAFRLVKKEKGLSVNRSSLISAEDSYNLRLSSGRKSVGCLSVTVGEVQSEDVELAYTPIEPDDRSHSEILMGALDENRYKLVRRNLHQAAIERGFIHGPIEE